ncbi:hypothetical protein IRZ71_05510 [Flavobacterium sp. ANB]|uniref:hypothetical protein n=1 Tax=unclassified Flavobacterium TaxID=196869 RepID=UPI0012B9F63C|nr:MULTISPECIES: hypothetical protein [unclassified Flavobacterium]MBF4515787.1 hypothetical protein [Flavobacterium sp. ANB]MTD68790.1 hypothetical protein [Flavobacterium sp. LC2016-13]
MEKQNNHEYGQTDPDYIDQNTLIDGSYILNENQYEQKPNQEDKLEFGESDPDYIEQDTLVDNDNYARDEDPYQYKEEFIEDLKNPENSKYVESQNTLSQEEIANKQHVISNDEKKNNDNEDK